MRPLALMTCLLMITSCYAWKIASYEDSWAVEEKNVSKSSLALQESLDARLPVQGKASVGHVTRHAIAFPGLSSPIFIIGDDAVSRQWLKKHAEQLRKIHALGFITNINNPDTLQQLQRTYDVPLLPADVDDLLALLGTDHYPLVLHEGIVWQ